MVPVTVERRVQGDLASLQLWLEGCRHLKDVDQSTCPRPMEWANAHFEKLAQERGELAVFPF
jgi:hypothetical protein